MDNAIEIQDVSKEFGAIRAVDRVSLSIPRGAVFGLIGPNGAGKTTTFSMVAGFLRPTSGTMRVLGFAPHDVGNLKGRVGVLPQDAVLPLGDRVGDFLTDMARLQGVPALQARAEAQRALDAVGGREWERLKCGALSHGMAKRVGVAQAVLGNPELVLLDEPTAGLDPRTAYQMRQFIRQIGGNRTIIVSSHNLPELEEVCSAAAILDRGRLIAAGSMASLTAAAEEVRVQLSPGPGPPIDVLRGLPNVRDVRFEPSSGELMVAFHPGQDPEAVISTVLRTLLDHGARVAGVAKGRKLEQRVMELT